MQLATKPKCYYGCEKENYSTGMLIINTVIRTSHVQAVSQNQTELEDRADQTGDFIPRDKKIFLKNQRQNEVIKQSPHFTPENYFPKGSRMAECCFGCEKDNSSFTLCWPYHTMKVFLTAKYRNTEDSTDCMTAEQAFALSHRSRCR